MAGRLTDSSTLTPWIEFRFDRATGPGGQNVNKVSTRATLLLDFETCPLLTGAEKARIRRRLASRIAADGRLRVVSQKYRTQAGNRAAARQRLVDLLTQALHVSKPRRPTRPTAASRERRLKAKRQRGEIKSLRRRRPAADD